MNDLEWAYTALAQEADTVQLTTAELLRARADRRARVRIATACTVIAAVVGGATVGTQWVLKASGLPVAPGTSQSAAVGSPSPASSAPAPSSSAGAGSPTHTRAAPTSIPDSAFLQLADTNGDYHPYRVPDDNMLPSLCGATYASDANQARQTMHIIWTDRQPAGITFPDGTFDQTITTYRPEGATRFMAQLRAAVTACPTETRDGTTYKHRLLSGSTYGDESMLIEMRYPRRDYINGNPIGGDDFRLVSVVRIGEVVMVLYEQGWEEGSSDRAVVDTFTKTAVSRLRAWLG